METSSQSRRPDYQQAWAHRKLMRRLWWGAALAGGPLAIASLPLSTVLDAPIVTRALVAACGILCIYGAFASYYFKCPNCGQRFEEGRWWPFPDRCGHCGIVAGTMPPAEPDDPARRAQRDA